MDYNEDRQVVVEEDYEDNWVDSWVQVVDHDDYDKKGFIYINTIGEYYLVWYFFSIVLLLLN